MYFAMFMEAPSGMLSQNRRSFSNRVAANLSPVSVENSGRSNFRLRVWETISCVLSLTAAAASGFLTNTSGICWMMVLSIPRSWAAFAVAVTALLVPKIGIVTILVGAVAPVITS